MTMMLESGGVRRQATRRQPSPRRIDTPLRRTGDRDTEMERDSATTTPPNVRARAALRAANERRLALAEHLPASERDLIDAVFDRGVSIAALARATGVRPRRLQQRLERIARRMNSPLFRFIIEQRDCWPSTRRRVAELVVVHNESRRATAERLGVSLHRVRKELEAVSILLEQAIAMGRFREAKP